MRSSNSGTSGSGGQKPGPPLSGYPFDLGLPGLSSSTPLAALKDGTQQLPPGQSSLPAKPSWTPVSLAPLNGRGSQVQGPSAPRSSKAWIPQVDSSKSGGVGDVFGDLLGSVLRDGGLNQRSSAPALGSNSGKGVGLCPPKSAPMRLSSRFPLASNVSSSTAFDPFITPSSAPVSAKERTIDSLSDIMSQLPTSASASASASTSATLGDPFPDFFSFPAFGSGNASVSSSSGPVAAGADDPFGLMNPSFTPAAPVGQGEVDLFGLTGSVGSSSATGDPFLQGNADPFESLGMMGKGSRATAAGPTVNVNDSITPLTRPTQSPSLNALWASAAAAPSSGSLDLREQPREARGSVLTTELEGLGPPPAGVTAVTANSRGAEYYRQGQFPDAIKWLCWAVDLLQEAGDNSQLKEILSCRIFCYREVGEYRKAVADCSKVLEIDKQDTSVLLQRAFLYESMEKYSRSVEDFREVLRRDPSHKVAANTLTRLTKMMARPSFNL